VSRSWAWRPSSKGVVRLYHGPRAVPPAAVFPGQLAAPLLQYGGLLLMLRQRGSQLLHLLLQVQYLLLPLLVGLLRVSVVVAAAAAPVA